MNKYNLNIVISLVTICVVLMGAWAIQASSATTTGANNPQFQGAANTRASPGMKVQQGTKLPMKINGGIYCNKSCAVLPDLWGMPCAQMCPASRG